MDEECHVLSMTVLGQLISLDMEETMTLTLDRIFMPVAVTLCICHICPPYKTDNGVFEVKCQCFLSEDGRRPEGTEQSRV